jgi:hypothetical protein
VDFDDIENVGQHIGIRAHKGGNRPLAGRVKNEQGPYHPAIGTVEERAAKNAAATVDFLADMLTMPRSRGGSEGITARLISG